MITLITPSVQVRPSLPISQSQLVRRSRLRDDQERRRHEQFHSSSGSMIQLLIQSFSFISPNSQASRRSYTNGLRSQLLDEATSALDSHSKAQIQAAISAAPRKRTTIMMAHQLTSVQNADRILVLDKSKMVKEGNMMFWRVEEDTNRGFALKDSGERGRFRTGKLHSVIEGSWAVEFCIEEIFSDKVYFAILFSLRI